MIHLNFFDHERLDAIKRNVFHPALVDVWHHGASKPFQMLVGMVDIDKLRLRFTLYILLGFHLNGDNPILCLKSANHIVFFSSSNIFSDEQSLQSYTFSDE